MESHSISVQPTSKHKTRTMICNKHPRKDVYFPKPKHTKAQTNLNTISQIHTPSIQSNLFQAGFEDCASEVIRFLTERENMDAENPILEGLRSHLCQVSNIICPEKIADLDNNTQTSGHLSHHNGVDITTPINIEDNAQPCPSSSMSLPLYSSLSLSPLNSCTPLTMSVPTHPHGLKRKHTSISTSDYTGDKLTHQISLKKQCHVTTYSSQPDDTTTFSTSTDCQSNLSSPVSTLSSTLLSSSSISSAPTTASWSNSPLYPLPIFPLSSPLSSATTLIPQSPPPSLLSSLSSSSVTPDNPNSILELNANLLPGVDSPSLVSGNFADILLVVELCQSHGDPRVRELANKIIDLIHNDDVDDEDDIDDEEDDDNSVVEASVDDDCNGRHITTLVGHDDSGIDLEEGVIDWCDPADMIET